MNKSAAGQRAVNSFRTKEEMEQALRAAGCRITRQRRVILDYLASTGSHPSAREVHREVKRRVPHVSLATVYNTLGTLVRRNLLRLIDFESRDNRYDRDTGPHINLICTACGGIEDYDRGYPVPLDEVRTDAGFEVRDARMEYYGECARCRARARHFGKDISAKRRNEWRRKRT